ncbi:MAG: metallophosphoesterase [Desulfitobacteriaceae bacterium]
MRDKDKDKDKANPKPPARQLTRRSFVRSLSALAASHWGLTSVSLGGTGLFAWAEYDTRTLKLEQWDLYYPDLPEPLAGKSIVQLSDLHLENLKISPHRIQETVASAKPDLLVLTGDVIETRTDLDKVRDYLAPLQASSGKYLVMGNNDYSHFSRTLFTRYSELVQELGWVVLINDATYLSELKLWLIGVDDPATAHDDVDRAYSRLNASSPNSPTSNLQSFRPFRLVLAHSSDCLDGVAKYGADLMLTGHTHGGQIRLPGFPPFMTNTYLGDKGIYQGYHIINGVPLYINRGIGNSKLALRFNVTPEVAVFTLHQGPQNAVHS